MMVEDGEPVKEEVKHLKLKHERGLHKSKS